MDKTKDTTCKTTTIASHVITMITTTWTCPEEEALGPPQNLKSKINQCTITLIIVTLLTMNYMMNVVYNRITCLLSTTIKDPKGRKSHENQLNYMEGFQPQQLKAQTSKVKETQTIILWMDNTKEDNIQIWLIIDMFTNNLNNDRSLMPKRNLCTLKLIVSHAKPSMDTKMNTTNHQCLCNNQYMSKHSLKLSNFNHNRKLCMYSLFKSHSSHNMIIINLLQKEETEKIEDKRRIITMTSKKSRDWRMRSI